MSQRQFVETVRSLFPGMSAAVAYGEYRVGFRNEPESFAFETDPVEAIHTARLMYMARTGRNVPVFAV